MKKNIFLPLAVAFSVILYACSAGGDADNAISENSSVKVDVTVLDGLAETNYHLGETAVSNNYKIQFNSVDATPEFEGYEDAEPGTEYFFASFELENISQNDLELDSLFTVTADGTECKLTRFYDSYNGVDWLDYYSTLSAGRKTQNYISAIVPEKWNEIQIDCSGGTLFTFAHSDLGSLSAPESNNESQVYHVGDTITRNGLKVTLESVMQTDYIQGSSSWYYEPDEGKHFVVLFFDIKNITEQKQRFDIYSSFDVFIDDYTDNFTSAGSSTKINDLGCLSYMDYTDILSGKSMAGYQIVEASDGWQKIEIASRQGTFEITPDMVSLQ